MVFTLDTSLCSGGHYYNWSSMEKTLYGMVHSFLASNYITNADHPVTLEVLVRYMSFLHSEMIVKGRTHKGLYIA